MVKLIEPKEEYLDSYISYCQEAYDHKIVTYTVDDPKYLRTYREHVIPYYREKALGTDIARNGIRSIHYWAIDEDEVVGEFQLRPELFGDWLTDGGNISFAVRVSLWHKGYGFEIFRLGLGKAREFGLMKVFLTVDDDNSTAIEIIKANGGVLEDIVVSSNRYEGQRLIRRYWINLQRD